MAANLGRAGSAFSVVVYQLRSLGERVLGRPRSKRSKAMSAKEARRLARQQVQDTVRSLLRVREHALALDLVEALERADLMNPELELRKAVAMSYGERWRESLPLLRQYYGQYEDGRHRVVGEYARTLDRMISETDHNANTAHVEELVGIVSETLGQKEGSIRPQTGNTLARVGYLELGKALIDRFIEQRPNDRNGYVCRSRLLIESGEFEEGVRVLKQVVQRWPDDAPSALRLRVLSSTEGITRETEEVSLGLLDPAGQGGLRLFSAVGEPLGRADLGGRDLQTSLKAAGCTYLAISPAARPPAEAAAQIRHALPASHRAGCLRLPDGTVIWRTGAVLEVVDTGLADSVEALPATLAAVEAHYDATRRQPPPGHPRVALLISRWGGAKFGGAEHTLRQFADIYRERGYSIILGGSRGDALEETDPSGNLVVTLPSEPGALRRFILEHDVSLVHAISGTGYEVAAALGWMSIRFIYGIHFWREVLGYETGQTFFGPDGAPIPRQEFAYIARRASAIYVNSEYTRGIVEKAHGVRYPVVYSVPEEESRVVH